MQSLQYRLATVITPSCTMGYRNNSPIRGAFVAIWGTINKKDPTALMSEPPATQDALLYRPPMKLTNRTTARAPMSWELVMRADLELWRPNCFSRWGKAALAIPFTVKPSVTQSTIAQKTKIPILLNFCMKLKRKIDFVNYELHSSRCIIYIAKWYWGFLRIS